MQSAKRIVASLRRAESLLLINRVSPARSLHSNTNPYSQRLTLLPSSSLSKKNGFLDTHHHRHQKVRFSSNPNSVINLLTTIKEWSKDLEIELEKMNPPTLLTHEVVSYVLMSFEGNPLSALDFFKWVSEKHGFKPSSLVYGQILRIFSNKETINEFWGLTKQMSKDGCSFDRRTVRLISENLKNSNMSCDIVAWTHFLIEMNTAAAATVKPLASVISKSEWNSNLEKKLAELTKVALSENSVLSIFWRIQGHPLKALCFFRWLREYLGYTHNAVTYNSILRVLAQEKSLTEFWSMVRELKSEGHDIDIDTYLKISRQFQRIKKLDDLINLYDLMLDGPYKPPAKESTFIIRSSCILATDSSDVKRLCKIVRKYEATGQTLFKVSYDHMHRCFLSMGELDEAEKVLDAMRSVGFEPDHLTYSHGVFELCKSGKVEEAIKMFDEMQLKGCLPDRSTWNFILQGFCIALDIDQVLKCFKNMKENDIDVDESFLEDLVNSLCNKKKVNSAYVLVTRSITDANLSPSLSTYEVLITKLLGESLLEEGTNLLRLMKEHNFHTSTIYQSLEQQVMQVNCSYLLRKKTISKFGTAGEASELLNVLV